MPKTSQEKPLFTETCSRAINYQYFDSRARKLRSKAVSEFVKSLFTGKNNSCVKTHEKISTLESLRPEADERELDPLKKTA